jgi:hypothetical protein
MYWLFILSPWDDSRCLVLLKMHPAPCTLFVQGLPNDCKKQEVARILVSLSFNIVLSCVVMFCPIGYLYLISMY